MSDKESIAAGLAALALDHSPQQLDQLAQYVALVQKWNRTINLVSRQDVGRFVSRHLLDSLTLLPLLHGQRLLDIGTGGGLPGLPLAIMCPQRQFSLVDRSERKIRFVRQVVRQLSLTNVEPLAADAATLAKQPQFQPYVQAVSRAMAPPSNMWALVAPLLVARAGGANAKPASMLLQASVHDTSDSDTSAAAVNGELLGFSAEQANQIDIVRHQTQVPGLQSVHHILEISQRTPLCSG